MEKVKVELPSDILVTEKSSKTGKSSWKPQEISEVAQEDKKQMSKMEGCINKEDAEWYQESISGTFNQFKTDLLKDELLNVLIERFMSEIHRNMQHIKLQPEIGLAEIRDIVDTVADKEATD